jgi:hypothetical protein
LAPISSAGDRCCHGHWAWHNEHDHISGLHGRRATQKGSSPGQSYAILAPLLCAAAWHFPYNLYYDNHDRSYLLCMQLAILNESTLYGLLLRFRLSSLPYRPSF